MCGISGAIAVAIAWTTRPGEAARRIFVVWRIDWILGLFGGIYRPGLRFVVFGVFAGWLVDGRVYRSVRCGFLSVVARLRSRIGRVIGGRWIGPRVLEITLTTDQQENGERCDAKHEQTNSKCDARCVAK